MRLKTTYFVCEIDSGPGSLRCVNSSELFTAIKRLYCELHGDSGWGKAAALLAVKHVDQTTRLCVVRSATECRFELHACLAMLKLAGSLPIAVCVRGIATTVRTLKNCYALHYYRITGINAKGIPDSTIFDDFGPH